MQAMQTNDTTKTVSIADIVIGKRSRSLDKGAVASLATSIGEVGLLQPIVVAEIDTEDGKALKLVAGRHRLAAVEKLGHTDIRAVVRKGLTADELSILEIDENLTRHNLSPAEQATWLERRVKLWDKINATVEKAKGKKKAEMSVRDVAKKMGVDKDKVHRALKRGRALGEDVLESVKGTKLDKGVELDALTEIATKKGKAAAKEAVEAVKSGKSKSVREVKKAEAVITPNTKASEKKARTVKALKTLRKLFDEYQDVRELDDLASQLAGLEIDFGLDQ